MQRSLSLLVHGHSKAGKSLLSVSGPAPRLYLDFEAAARFLPIQPKAWDPRDAPPAVGPDWDTAVVTIRHWDQVHHVIDWLRHGNHPFRSVSMDSISEAQNRFIESLAGRGTMKIDQWGSALREIGGVVRDLRDLTIHPSNPIEAVVITAMSREINNVWRPHLQGQMMTVLPYLLDVIGWLYVQTDQDGTEHRLLQTRRSGTVEAGERVGGRIPPLLELPFVSGAESNVTMQLLIETVFSQAPSTVPEPGTAPTTQGA